MTIIRSGRTSRKASEKASVREIVYFSEKILASTDPKNLQDYFKNQKNTKNLTKAKPLYIADLTKSSSKYIGETEKNLGKIFQKAKKMNGILLFDEADALFGKRTKIKDSHDRYANIETNYLIKKIQKYKGLLFISSTTKTTLSENFLKNLDYVICLSIKK